MLERYNKFFMISINQLGSSFCFEKFFSLHVSAVISSYMVEVKIEGTGVFLYQNNISDILDMH